MTQRATMTVSSRLCQVDWMAGSRLNCRTFSFSSSVLTSPVQWATAKSSLHSHEFLGRVITRRCFAHPLISPNLETVRYMSSTREPPDIPGKSPLPAQKNGPEREIQEKQNRNGLENTLRFVKDEGPGFQSLSKQVSESSSVTNNITNEINLASPYGIVRKDGMKPDDWNDILNRWYVKYQDFIGITDLKKAQDRVTELSEGLLGAQSRRRNLQAELEVLQDQLTINHQRITKTELYSDEHYQLFDQARDMNARLKEVRSEFESCERLERDTFSQLSAAIRDCHERERTQAEQSKYWSIIASIVSAALASVITSVNNWVRIREIKDHVSLNNQQLLEGYQKMHEDVVGAVNASISSNASTPVRKSEVTVVQSTTGDVDIAEKTEGLPSASGVSTARLAEEDVIILSKSFGEILKQQISDVLANETKYMQETLKPHLDAIFSNLGLILESNQMLADTLSSGVERDHKATSVIQMSKMDVISPSLPDGETEKHKGKTIIVDHSYRHIASAMAVGAGIGTLATAFLLGSFSGGAGE